MARMRHTPDGLFDRATAITLGWTDGALCRAVRSGRLIRPRHGLYCRPEHADSPALGAVAAARACRGSVVSHRSAALLHGVPLLGTAGDRRPGLTLPPRSTGDVKGALLHRAQLWPEDIVDVDGTPVTSVARTVADLARSSPIATSVVAADAALHRGLVTRAEIDDVLRRCWIWPGIRRAWRAVPVIDAPSESPLESVSRLVIEWLGLPAPDLQAVVLARGVSFLARVDFYWPEFGVVGEADGAVKYADRSVLFAEKLRQEALEQLGLVVVRWGWQEVSRRPHQLRARLESAFERGRHRDRSGFPRNWSVRAA